MNSNGTLSGTDYTNNLTFSRIRYQKGAVLSHYAGDTFYMSEYVDAAGTTWTVRDVQPSIDFVNRRLLIGCRTTDMRHNVIYDLDAVLALGKETVEITRTWGGETAAEGVTEKKTETTSVEVRNLNRLTPLGSFRLPSYLNTGQTHQVYSYSHQGQACGATTFIGTKDRRSSRRASCTTVRWPMWPCSTIPANWSPPHAGGRLLPTSRA